MNRVLNIVAFFSLVSAVAQTALYNNGNIRIHEGGNLGFHTDFINDSPFDDNLGLVGFYGAGNILVSGNIVPMFNDVEMAANNGLLMLLGLDVSNNTNFIFGDINTPRNDTDIFYTFLTDGFYNGEGNLTKINGYNAITNKQSFMFPVGDSELLRPLTLNSQGSNPFAKCAYFFENPVEQTVIPGNFSTQALDLDLERVSNTEFWRLESNITSTISINWNERSNLSSLTDDPAKIVIVGWGKLSQRWINLGATMTNGDLNNGVATSEPFLPNDYEIITFGVTKIPFEQLEKDVLTLDNFFISPNGDGINDSFYVEELEESPNNMVRIYDRFGLKVFEKANYVNEFVGFSNVDNFVIAREDGLPVGVYFYTIDMLDLDLKYQGFLYLAR